jgi:spore germination cell wall hydrolase CwlJ-like protein
MPKEIFEKLSDLELITLCVYGEARNQGLDGMLGVASVIVNRAKHPSWWGSDIKTVVLKPKQFSCLNENDPNVSILRQIAEDFSGSLSKLGVLRLCHWICRGLLEGMLYSNVGSATHYHTVNCDPEWDDNMRLIKKINQHVFFEVKKK